MSSSHFTGVLRTLLPPGLERIQQPSPTDEAQTAKVDFLFLYRSEKKRQYFSRVAREALGDYRCLLACYHNLPAARGRPLPSARLGELLNKAEQELFNARDGHWMVRLRPLLLWLRRIQIRKMHARLSALLDDLDPGVIVVWNGRKFQDHVLHAVNERGIPVVYFENGVLPASTTVDTSGINADSSIPRTVSFYSSRPEEHFTLHAASDRQARKRLVKKEFQAIFPKDVARGMNILLPFQKERDTQILDHSPWIRSMPQLYSVASQAIRTAGLGEYHLWLREHPSAATNYPSICSQVAKASDCSFANGARLADWLAKMDLVITINSSVGMEALLMGKKVITLGLAFYNIPGLVEYADSPEALTQAIQRVMTNPVDERLRQSFLSFLVNHYVVSGDWRKPDSHHWVALKERMVPALTMQARLASAENLQFS